MEQPWSMYPQSLNGAPEHSSCRTISQTCLFGAGNFAVRQKKLPFLLSNCLRCTAAYWDTALSVAWNGVASSDGGLTTRTLSRIKGFFRAFYSVNLQKCNTAFPKRRSRKRLLLRKCIVWFHCTIQHLLVLTSSQCTDTIPLPQFVPFRDYMDRTGNHVLSMARLAKDVLAEIPDQFISYMKSRGIKPNPAPPPYTPPGHTHHHTQIWTFILSTFSASASGSYHSRVPWELSACCFSWCTQAPTDQEMGVGCFHFVFFLERVCLYFSCRHRLDDSCSILSASVLFVFFSSVPIDLAGFSDRETTNLSGKTSLLNWTLRQWLFGLWCGSRSASERFMSWLKLVPVCGCFSQCVRTRELWP